MVHCACGKAGAQPGPWRRAAYKRERPVPSVIVKSAAVPAPVAVRYGWADNPACNLYNSDGLPAEPFRTDDWN